MKKRRKNIICIIGIAAVLLTTALAVYGNETIEKITELAAEKYSIAEIVSDDTQLQQETSGTSSKFEQMLEVMNATIEDDKEFNSLLYSYKYIEKAYNAPQSDMDYIADRVIEGCDMGDIINVYHFWRDTNEDINIIKQIYDLKENYIIPRTGETAKYWIEKAFNKVIENKCGVLSGEDIDNYMSQGITVENIQTANVLCRKGVYTIQQILDKKMSGQTFAEIANEIENGGYEMTQSFGISMFSFASDEEAEGDEKSLEEIIDENVLISRELSEITGEEPKKFLDKARQGEDLSEMLNDEDDRIRREVLAELEDKNILRNINYMSENE